MKNRRAILYAICATIAALVVQSIYLSGVERRLASAYEPIPVLVAARDIPPGATIDDSMVDVIEIPKKFLAPRAIRNIDSIFGQIAAIPILRGDQLSQTRLLSIEEAGLARKVPPGRRAVAVAVNRVTGVAGHLRPGNHVDLLGTFDFGERGVEQIKIMTIFQNVEVLSVGDSLGQAVAAEGSDQKGEAGPYYDLTLSMTPQEAQSLVIAQHSGLLSVTLRRHSREDDMRLGGPIDLAKALKIKKSTKTKPPERFGTITPGLY